MINKSAEIPMTTGQLRFRYAINHFKHLVLGDLHIQGEPQTDSVLDELGKLADKPPFSGRTWQEWFSKTPPIPKIGKIQAMDDVALELSRVRWGGDEAQRIAPKGMYSEMVYGGLMRSLLAPSKSKKITHTLMGRVHDYEPLSPLHLHLDAIEAAAWGSDFEGVSWFVVAKIAAQGVFGLLAERWSPRHGSLYGTFRSDFQIRWDAADPEERKNIRASCARWNPDLFDTFMQRGAQPNWRKTGYSEDIAPMHIYKLLFALAADPEFLIEDRLDAWVLDLATAALALHGLAWTDRYTTMLCRVTDEMLYWAAFNEIIFDSKPLKIDGLILPAAAHSKAEWSHESFGAFRRARKMYRKLIVDGGLTVKGVLSVAMSARRTHPLAFRG